MLEVEDFSQRGDAPALAIIQDNARKKAIRQVVETQEELTRIHERVTRVRNLVQQCRLPILHPLTFILFALMTSFSSIDYRRVRAERKIVRTSTRRQRSRTYRRRFYPRASDFGICGRYGGQKFFTCNFHTIKHDWCSIFDY